MYRIIVLFSLFSMIYACKDSVAVADVKPAPNTGFNYKHFVETGGEKPNVGDWVYFTMDIYDDKDSILQRNTEQTNYPSVEVLEPTNPGRLSNPIIDVMSILAVGDSAAIIFPADSIQGGLPPNMSHVKSIEYHVVIQDILTAQENQAKKIEDQAKAAAKSEEVINLTEETLAQYKAGQLDVKVTPGGVKYHIHEDGTGGPAINGQMVTFSYYGRTVSTGEKFDESFSRGRGYSFRVGQDAVIQGWHDVAPYLPLGSTASFFIPAEMGYGAQGSPPVIPPNAELYFYVSVDKILN